MRHRYDYLSFRFNHAGEKFWEIADHKTGVIFWVKAATWKEEGA